MITREIPLSISSQLRPLTSMSNHPLSLFNQTLTQGFYPDRLVFISAIKACALVSALPEGKTIHARVIASGLGSDKFLVSSLIRFYAACGQLKSARQLFDEILDKDVTLRTTMLMGYALNGSLDNARKVFDEMIERDVVAWNAMLTAYAQCGLPISALDLFREMQISKVSPNEITLVSILSATSQVGCLAVGFWIHAYIDKISKIRVTPTLNNSLVHMYAKCGRLDAALSVFVERGPRNLESWNTMLTSFALHGYGTCSLSLFSQMMKMGLVPDKISFLGVLMACSHGGMIDDALRCFDCMRRVYYVEPKIEHYGCMVDVLSRGGLLGQACVLVENMPFEPDAYAWGALLSGCLIHGDNDLGLHAAHRLLQLEPWEEGRYITLSNLYAARGNHEVAVKVRKVMIDKGIKKSSGSSTIEINGVIHKFLAGDRSHFDMEEIYDMIMKIEINSRSHCCLSWFQSKDPLC